jgi:NADPH:quinone reductase-like Zn-dependent oxidoreductase
MTDAPHAAEPAPPTMRAALVRAHGGFDAVRVETVPTPRPGPGEVLVRVRAAGVNHLDAWVRRGLPGVKLPMVLGSDAAGEIVALGPGAERCGLPVGARVFLYPATSCGRCRACARGDDPLCADYAIFGEHVNGVQAEYAVVPWTSVLALPERLSFEEGAAFPLTFLTAWHMLVRRAQVRLGEWVLVHAAGSGVGAAAVQIARLHGARTIATAGGAEKCRRALALGADHAVDYTAQSFRDEALRVSEGAGMDVVVEHVGAATFKDSLRALARGGRLVTCGATTGPKVELHLPALFMKGVSILGSTMGSRAEMMDVAARFAAGQLRAVVDRVLPLAEVATAHRLLEERAVFGKVVLLP